MKETKELKIVIKPQKQDRHWVGNGFYVHTMIHPTPDLYPHISPFLLMDYAPPMSFSETTNRRGVGSHPHRGFETVTFAIQGKVEHRDSAGGGGVIREGDVQWMTAASGLVHDQFHSEDFSKKGGMFEMVQLWVNLPASKKMTSPRYQGVKNEQFPRVSLGQATTAQVVAGSLGEANGPCETHTDINAYRLHTSQEDKVELSFKENTNTLILILRGGLSFGDQDFDEKSLLIFERDGSQIDLNLKENTELLVLNGDPIDEPVAAHGPFVMNTRQELIQAFEDFQNGKMGRL